MQTTDGIAHRPGNHEYHQNMVGVSIVQKMILDGSAGRLAFFQSRENPSAGMQVPCAFLPRTHYISILLKF